MPLIAYPSVNIGRHPDESEDTILTLPVDRTELVLETPSRNVHVNPATQDVTIVNRGPAYWFLTLTFGPIEAETELHREFEQWLARMHDLRNYANIPLGNRAFDGSLVPLANDGIRRVQSVTGNTRTLDVALYHGDAGSTSPLPVGSYIKVDNQVAMLDSISDTGLNITTTPLLGEVGNFITLAETMRCRLAGGGEHRIGTSNGMTEPLTVPFQEFRR